MRGGLLSTPATSPSRDDDGYLTYVGRTDDVFKASDYKISPFELESVLIEHPAVAEAAVVPAPTRCGSRCRRRTSCSPPGYEPDAETARSDPALRPRTPRRRTSGSAASSSSTCRRRSPARSAGSSCADAKTSSPPAAPANGATTSSPTSSPDPPPPAVLERIGPVPESSGEAHPRFPGATSPEPAAAVLERIGPGNGAHALRSGAKPGAASPENACGCCRLGSGRAPAERLRGPARLAEPAHARLLRRHGVRHAEPRPLRPRAGTALHPPRHRLAALHAGPPRHPVRRPRLPVEAVGLDRAVGAADHRARCGTTASPAMLVTDHPHLFETGGENYHTDFFAWELPAGPRGRSVADPPRPVVDRRRRRCRPTRRLVLRAGVRHRARRRAYDRSRTFFREEADYPRAPHDGRGRRASCPRPRPTRPLVPASSTSSTPTSPSTPPSPGRRVRGRAVGRRVHHLAAVRRRRREQGR